VFGQGRKKKKKTASAGLTPAERRGGKTRTPVAIMSSSRGTVCASEERKEKACATISDRREGRERTHESFPHLNKTEFLGKSPYPVFHVREKPPQKKKKKSSDVEGSSFRKKKKEHASTSALDQESPTDATARKKRTRQVTIPIIAKKTLPASSGGEERKSHVEDTFQVQNKMKAENQLKPPFTFPRRRPPQTP